MRKISRIGCGPGAKQRAKHRHISLERCLNQRGVPAVIFSIDRCPFGDEGADRISIAVLRHARQSASGLSRLEIPVFSFKNGWRFGIAAGPALRTGETVYCQFEFGNCYWRVCLPVTTARHLFAPAINLD